MCKCLSENHSNNQAIKQSNNQAIKQSSNQTIKQSKTQAIKQSSNQTITIDVSRWAAGTYFVRIVNDSGAIVKKLILR